MIPYACGHKYKNLFSIGNVLRLYHQNKIEPRADLAQI